MIVIMIAITTIVMDTTMIITRIIVTIIKPRTWQLVPQDCYQLADNLTQTRDDLRDNDWVIELLLWFCQYCQDMFCGYPPLVKMSTELWTFWRWVQCSTFCKTLQMTLTPLSTHAHLDQVSHTAFILSSDQKQQLPMCNSWKMWIKIKPRSDGLFSSMYVCAFEILWHINWVSLGLYQPWPTYYVASTHAVFHYGPVLARQIYLISAK